MNASTREILFATKDQLHQLTQLSREESNRETSSRQEEIERARQKAKAMEEKRYLRQHNKTVTRVLNQAARASNQVRASSEEEEREEELEEESESSDQEEHQERHRSEMSVSAGNSGEKGKEREVEPTLSGIKGKSLRCFSPIRFSFFFIPWIFIIPRRRREGSNSCA